MKTFKKIVCGLVAVCLAAGLLSACGAEPETAAYSLDLGDEGNTAVSFEYREEQIEAVSAEMRVYVASSDIDTARMLQEFYDELFEPVKDKNFASYSYEHDGDYFVLKFSFTDLDVKENADALASLELLPGYTSETAMSEVKESLAEEGYTETAA